MAWGTDTWGIGLWGADTDTTVVGLPKPQRVAVNLADFYEATPLPVFYGTTHMASRYEVTDMKSDL